MLWAGLALLLPLALWSGFMGGTNIKYYLHLGAAPFLSALLFFHMVRDGKIRFPALALWGPWALFLCYTSAVSWAGSASDGVLWASQAASLLLFFVAVVLGGEQGALRRFLLAWQYATIIVCVYYLLQRMGWDFRVQPPYDQNPVGSFLDNRNYLFYYLVCALPFSLYLLSVERGSARMLAALAAGLALTAFFCGDSRAGQGILLLTLPVYLGYYAYHHKESRVRFGFRAVALCWGLALAGCGALLVFRLASVGASYLDALTHGRAMIWAATLDLIGEAPWLGHGCGSFPALFPGFQPPEFGVAFDMLHPILGSHNVVLELLVEYGVVGLLLFGLGVAGALGWLERGAPRGCKDERLYFFSLVALGSCALFGMVGEIANTPFCTFFSWAALAIFYHARGGRLHCITLAGNARLWGWGVLALWCWGAGLAIYWTTRVAVADYTLARATRLMENPSTWRQAGRELDRALAWRPGYTLAFYQRACLAARLGNTRLAVADYRAILRTRPFFDNIHFNLGVVLLARKEYAQAIVSLREASRLYPRYYPAPYLLAQAYFSVGNWHECLVWCDYLSRNHMDSEDSRLLHRKALELYERAKG